MQRIGKSQCLLLLWILLLAGCEKPSPHVSLDDIMAAGEITVITRNNYHCYYIYRDQAMGFEYDLAKAFADYIGVRLKITIAEKWEGMIPSLIDGSGALIAASYTITPARQKQVAFSDGYMDIRQHIIVNRKNRRIRSAKDLDGKTVHVRKGTSYQERLESLKAGGIRLAMRLHEDIPTEELIQQVAEENIEVTIADSNIAFRNRRYFPQVIVAEPIGPIEQLGWAVNPKSAKLLETINEFFRFIKANGRLQKIYDRYYANIDFFDYVDLRKYHRRLKTRLPKYLPFIEVAARDAGFDWRLIAAQIYQESHFNPKARSHAGAYGLMQLTRTTARSLGVKNIFDAEQNIRAGIKHLSNLYKRYSGANGSDRMFITLAAYNIGQGHVMDARSLARKMKLDPDRWSSMVKTLPLLRYRKYYRNTVYGYCRGTEPIEYVEQIMIYYDILRRQGIEDKA